MKHNFCTLFDSNYITRGLALHESLSRHCPSFHLYIFSFDNIATAILTKLDLQNTTIITLLEFEDEELLAVKPTRTIAEYCWTCTSSIIRYAIEKYHLDACTYLDADLFFYADPSVLIDEMKGDSVLITAHRYSSQYELSKTSGKYCVQFMTFKNDERGMHILNWWRKECLKWCYARFEDGKFGDQKYLDDWTTRFEGVHELQHIGGGVAPWNLQQYKFEFRKNKIFLKESEDKEFVEMVFFHFHGMRFYLNNVVRVSPSYFIPKHIVRKIYFPYVKKIMALTKVVEQIDDSFNPNAAFDTYVGKPYAWRFQKCFTWKDRLHIYKKSLLTFSLKKIISGHKELIELGYDFYLKSVK